VTVIIFIVKLTDFAYEHGFHASWKVMELKEGIFQVWKVMENNCGHGKSWKLTNSHGVFLTEV